MTAHRRIVGIIGSLAAFTAVALGAFGAHALGKSVEPDLLEIFETAVRYQFYHALALLVLAGASWSETTPRKAAAWLFTAGMIVFSGSLYALSLTGVRMWGAVTPIGGLCLLSGWVTLSVAFFSDGRELLPKRAR